MTTAGRTASLASAHTIRGAAAEILGTEAIAIRELVDRLTRRGLALGADPNARADRVVRALDGNGAFSELVGERWISVPALLDGTSWSTTVPSELAAIDCLPGDPDLELLTWWALDHPLGFVGRPGATVECIELDDGTDGLQGPVGWLERCAGGPARVDVVGTALAVEPLDQVLAPTAAQTAVTRASFERIADHDLLGEPFGTREPVELVTAAVSDLLEEALVADRAAFTRDPIPPVDDLLRAAGLARVDHMALPADADPQQLRRWQRRRRLATLHHLDDEDLDAVEILLAMSYRWIADATGQPEEMPEEMPDERPAEKEPPDAEPPDESDTAVAQLVAMCLTDPVVARVFVGEHAERGTEPAALAGFARRLLDSVPDGDVGEVGPRWLLARALDHLGDPEGAQAQLELAVESGFEHPLALQGLAAFVADRGDAPAALALLERAAALDDEPDLDEDEDATNENRDQLLDEVAPFARHRPAPAAGRNDPCPCGSGRKYKACHIGRERHALVDRAPWLYAKARRYLRDNRHRMLSAEIAATIHEFAGRDTGFLLDLLDSELVADLALCEGGVFEDFVAERDAILPDDEALLAAGWALTARSLFEVEWARGDELALGDLRTGDHIVVTNTHASDATRPGMLMLGRPLPVDDTWRAYSGFIHLPDSLRSAALDALDAQDPFEVATLIGRASAPPQMANTSGEPLVFHELTYRVPDPTAVAPALTTAGLDDHENGEFVLIRDTSGQAATLIMRMQLTDDVLEVNVNSDRRLDEAVALLAVHLPDAVLEAADERELDEVLADLPDAAPDDRGVRPADDDPELDDLLDEVVREREARWIDEPVPALGGRTPRDAVTDPIGRDEVERLLRSFDDMPRSRHSFDPDRLRLLLGLP